jgi:hypothetical protein
LQLGGELADLADQGEREVLRVVELPPVARVGERADAAVSSATLSGSGIPALAPRPPRGRLQLHAKVSMRLSTKSRVCSSRKWTWQPRSPRDSSTR